MAADNLTKEQVAFLEECNLEFSERYTDSDLEYKNVYDLGIPSPPIMYPWYGKRSFSNRDRGRGRHNDYRNRNQYYNNQDRNDGSNRSQEDHNRYREGAGSSYNNHRERYTDGYGGSNRDFQQRNRYRPY